MFYIAFAGTSACPAGKFYCRNVGSIPRFIFSSHVNDRFCGEWFTKIISLPSHASLYWSGLEVVSGYNIVSELYLFL